MPMGNKGDRNEDKHGFPVSGFWDSLETPPEKRIPVYKNQKVGPQNQVPDMVARVLEKTPNATLMAPYNIPQSYIEGDSIKKVLPTELPPQTFSHPEIPKVTLYNGSGKDRALQHYLSSIGRTQDAQSEVYLNTTEWMEMYRVLPGSSQEKVKIFEDMFTLGLYGVIDGGPGGVPGQMKEFKEAVYFWAHPTNEYIGCNAMRLDPNGLQPVFARNAHGLLLVLPKV